MMNPPSREMTLDEYIERLPTIHRARRDLEALRARLEKLLLVVEKARQCLNSGELNTGSKGAMELEAALDALAADGEGGNET